MANNYRSFSFALKLNNKTEAKWFQKLLEKAQKTETKDGGFGTDFDWTVFGLDVPKGMLATQELQRPHVWFRDGGEYGNVEQIADFVGKYLKKFFPKGYFLMEWADTCSKHRLGEFGGGVCVVTATEQYWFNSKQWAENHAIGLTSRNEP